jgi:hypothetical protein
MNLIGNQWVSHILWTTIIRSNAARTERGRLEYEVQCCGSWWNFRSAFDQATECILIDNLLYGLFRQTVSVSLFMHPGEELCHCGIGCRINSERLNLRRQAQVVRRMLTIGLRTTRSRP